MAKIKIATHSGKYHADDVFAVAVLELVTGEDRPTVIRTRRQDLIDSADYVVDVGGEHDLERKRFDHHQVGGAGRRENGVPYASFGLVWNAYGEQVAGSKDAASYVDQRLVQPIDAADMGADTFEVSDLGVKPYLVQDALQVFRPLWNEETKNDDVFEVMVDLAKRILSREVVVAQTMVEAALVVRSVYTNSTDKKVVVFGKDHPFGREVIGARLAEEEEPLYAVLYRPEPDAWQVLAVNESPGTLRVRKPFPEEWRGKKDETLEKETGVEGAYFCHNGGFMVMVQTKEGALKLAKKALDA